MRCAAILAAAALCAACSPRYDWREVRPEGLGCTAMLPGKPASMSREIDLDGLRVTMTMHGARVDGTAFTVAMARLPDDGAATAAKALAAMERGMLRNIGASRAGGRPASVRLVDASGAAVDTVPARVLETSGTANGRTQRMLAGFAARGGRAWQWTVIGESIDDEEAKTFMESFRIADGGGR